MNIFGFSFALIVFFQTGFFGEIMLYKIFFRILNLLKLFYIELTFTDF